MANMSFKMTTEQIRARTKTVTRRLGWQQLQPGEVITACVKCQGLGRGEKIERLARLRVKSVRREPLTAIDQADVAREGFAGMSPSEFVAMFCEGLGCRPDAIVTRIEFAYLDEPPSRALF